MRCSSCDQAEMQEGTTTVAFEHKGASYTFKKVPAMVCPSCGTSSVDEKINDQLMLRAEMLRESAAKVYIREY